MTISRFTQWGPVFLICAATGAGIDSAMPGTADARLSSLKALASARMDLAQSVRQVLSESPGGSQAVEAKLVLKKDRAICKIELMAGDALTEIEFDAVEGRLLSRSEETARGENEVGMIEAARAARISLLEAIAAATKEYEEPGVLKAQFETVAGRAACQVQLATGDRFVIVRVDAMTGQVCAAKQEPATAALWTFDRDKIGQLPPGWKTGHTGTPKSPAVWRIENDPEAEAGRVLALAKTANTGATYNLAMFERPRFKDLDLQVRVRAVSGEEDQGGGPIWRCQDENNYYICRLNPLENNFRLYSVKVGKRKQLKSADIQAQAGRWYILRVRMVGPRIECWVDDQKLLESEDETFSDAGTVGLWTKADAATWFDDLAVKAVVEVKPTSGPAPREQGKN